MENARKYPEIRLEEVNDRDFLLNNLLPPPCPASSRQPPASPSPTPGRDLASGEPVHRLARAERGRRVRYREAWHKHLNDHREEHPKVLISRSRRLALARCLVHALPTAITLGILSLSFRGVFWQEAGPHTNTTLNALQFAAAFHASLMIVSLTTALLTLVRHTLMSRTGIPLGQLTSGLQLNSTSYLFSADYWGGVLHKGRRTANSRVLATAVLMGIVLSAASGPSSAITMIPRLNWWPAAAFPSSSAGGMYMNTSASSWFPATVSGDLVSPFCINVSVNYSTELPADCPSSGFRAIIDAITLDTTGIERQATLNFSVSIAGSENVRYLYTTNYATRFARGNYIASSLPDFLARALSWDFATNPGPRLKYSAESSHPPQDICTPLVSVQCMGEGSNNPVVTFPVWGAGLQARNSGYSAEQDLIRRPKSQFGNLISDQVSSTTNFSWVDIGNRTTPILGAVYALPGALWPVRGTAGLNAVVACGVQARWLPTRVWTDPVIDNVVHQDYSGFDLFGSSIDEPVSLTAALKWNALDSLQIDVAWADSLNPKIGNQSALEILGAHCLSISCLTVGLSLYVADGLSRMHDANALYSLDPGPRETIPLNSPAHLSAPTPAELHDSTKYSRIRYETQHYGYGYGLESATVIAAAVVLMLQVLVSLVHIGVVLYSGTSSSAWGTIDELLVLAINSSPTKSLKNTGAGVGSHKTWGKTVRVREGAENHLELVFDSDEEAEEKKTREGLGGARARWTPVRVGKEYV